MRACDPACQPEAVEAFLATVPPFDRLPAADLATLAAASRVAFSLSGEVVEPDGCGGTGSAWICCVQRGGVRLGRPAGALDGSGTPETFDVRGEGECFGLPAASGDEVRALEDTFLVRLPGTLCAALARRHPPMAAWFGQALALPGDTGPEPAAATGECPAREADDGDYLFTRLAGEVASRTLAGVTRGMDLRQTARVMEDGQVGSVVVREASGLVIGIVTDRDLRRAVARGLALSAPVETLMSAPVADIDADTPCFEGLIRMTGAGIRHLLVTRDGEPSGMVTVSDLLLAHGRSPMALLRAIRRAGDFSDLRALCQRIHPLAAALAARGAGSGTVGGIVTMLAERVLGRLLELLEKAFGPCPAPCAWWVLGAAGRREMLPGMGLSLAVAPQDGNDPVVGRAARTYLAAFLPRLAEELGRLGLGGAALSLGDPRVLFDPAGCAADDDPLALEASLEAFDARLVAGCDRAGAEHHHSPPSGGAGGPGFDGAPRPPEASSLLIETSSIPRETSSIPVPPTPILAGLLRSLAARPVPLGLYQGRLMERDGTASPVLHIAGRGSRPLLALVRLAALLAGVGETGTAARLGRLARDGHLPGDVARAAVDAFAFFEGERLLLRLDAAGRTGEDEAPLRPAGLSPRRRQGFRAAFAGLEALRRILADRAWTGEGIP
ncbi:putative signal transduction protein with CBS domains [Solidesulfovibrio carbinoliphilus subsp. oakridgensis]|uniref:Signal transduction protein with CBS domains n=1 Tax=Solidesulfovibrio carbinoliphilus subsp. oakridgensis TaxID=694327 RepID=G7QCB8_9BACT|nr:putative nucleotidyltransferase substrate binding domain-containing protein [Solidesulfovibrio carbinoliphilus]EHJ46074.1 putative signal transduction protein with CBS domains [Solidesulfovibrio carbinoliphilus subsp. oakridgensis]